MNIGACAIDLCKKQTQSCTIDLYRYLSRHTSCPPKN